jgi:hypothetical protein
VSRSVVPPLRACEDCGGEVEPDVMPIGLFRPVEGAPENTVWDATKRRWVRRKGRARAGGRRWREYRLCRRCRAEALRNRSQNGNVMENGVRRSLRTRERVAPKKGGRPRLLSDEELRLAYLAYRQQGLSMLELARRFHAGRDKGTLAGYQQAILYGFRRLGYQLRPKGEQIGISRHGTDGTKSKPQKRRCAGKTRAGRRCRVWARKGQRCCWDHRNQEETNDGNDSEAVV